MRKTWIVRDLRNKKLPATAIQVCLECGGEYSVDAGDYWYRQGSDELTCCEQSVIVATKETVYEEIFL